MKFYILILNENGGNRSVHGLFKARSEEGLNTILINMHLMKDEYVTNSVQTMSSVLENAIVVSSRSDAIHATVRLYCCCRQSTRDAAAE